MNTDLTDKELRKIDYDFRTRASRVIRVQFRDVVGTLRQFLDYIESVPLLKNYVLSCKLPVSESEMMSEIGKVIEGHRNEHFHFVPSSEGELAQSYFILKQCCANSDDHYNQTLVMNLGMAYNSSRDTGFQSYVEAFINAIALRFIENVNAYLHQLTMRIKSDMERTYRIENNGGQVVIANDQSTVTASQNNMVNGNRFVELRDSVINAAKESGATEKQLTEIREILAEIEKHIKGPNPKKSLLNALLAGLDKIAGAVTKGTVLAERISAFATFVWDKLKDLVQ